MSNNIENFALIIGAMKSGTTTLFDYLSQHPEICVCQPKEPNFFSCDRQWVQGWNWYQSLWKWNPSVHEIALDASNSYTKIPDWSNAAERISQIKAEFKFIYIMRNPVERIESQYNFCKTFPGQHRLTFSEFMPHGIAVSKYAMQLDEYYKRFPCERILLLYFEDLKSRPMELVKKVCEFLNVAPSYNFQSLGKVSNPTVVESSLLGAIKSNKILHNLIMSIFTPNMRKIIKSPFILRKGKKFELSPEQREYILSELEEYMKKLKEKYGVAIERWGFEV